MAVENQWPRPRTSKTMLLAGHTLALALVAAISACSVPWPGGAETGLLLNEPGAYPGYTLFAPLNSTTTYLVDMEGEVVHRWESEYTPGQSVYLLDNGRLLRTGRDPSNSTFTGGGEGGLVQELSWDGTVTWELEFSDEHHRQHHDIEPLPNGNVLLIAWERMTREEAIDAGIDPERMLADELWPDFVVEIEPTRPDGGKTVWEWHASDHLVQDHDPAKPNYGVVEEHPELINLNAATAIDRMQEDNAPEEIERLRALGYVGGGSGSDLSGSGSPPIAADWLHINSIDYNPEHDLILLSVRSFSEIWIIDHGTTSEEAALHEGGRYGKGGDLLYRWGNPLAYGAGSASEQMLFVQHDAQWIPKGYPGEENILVFNNGEDRPQGDYSSVDEIEPPRDEEGRLHLVPGAATSPTDVAWSYRAAEGSSFYSARISGTQRLPNGNTLICSGEQGRLFEVNVRDEIVWEYVNPFSDASLIGRLLDARHKEKEGNGGRPAGGQTGTGGGPPPPPAAGGVFKAQRIPLDHPGLAYLDLQSS